MPLLSLNLFAVQLEERRNDEGFLLVPCEVVELLAVCVFNATFVRICLSNWLHCHHPELMAGRMPRPAAVGGRV